MGDLAAKPEASSELVSTAQDEKISLPAQKGIEQAQTLCQGPVAVPAATVKQSSEPVQACHTTGLQRSCHPHRSLESTPTLLSPPRRQTRAQSRRIAMLASAQPTSVRTAQSNDVKRHDELKTTGRSPSETKAKTAGQACPPTSVRAEGHAPAGRPKKRRLSIV